MQQFVFPIDNAKPGSFGYENYDDDEDVTASVICLSDCFAYVLDVYHNNVKRINIDDGTISISPRLGSRPTQWLCDVVVFHNRVYVGDSFDSIFVLSLQLTPLQSIPTPGRDYKFFVDVSPEHLTVWHQPQWGDDSLVKIDTLGHVGAAVPAVNADFDLYGAAHGKEYKVYDSVGVWYVRAGSATIKLQRPFPFLGERLAAINVDYDDSTLVFFDVNEREFTLYVYPIGKTEAKKSRQ
jgi:hypothetical protein